MEQCDDTASPNDESPSENGDSNVEPNYSLSDDSYSDSSDRNSCWLDEVQLNETQNVDLTVEREKQETKSRESKITIQSEWKGNKTGLIRNTGYTYRPFKRSTEVPERTIRLLVEQLVYWSIFLSSPSRKHLIFKKMAVCGRYQCQKKLHISFNEVIYTKIQIAAVMEGVKSNYSRAFCLVKRDLNSGVCSELCSYCWRDRQTHPDSDLTDEGCFVSDDRQDRNTRQARDSSRCSTVGVSSYIATVTVTAVCTLALIQQNLYWGGQNFT